MRHLIWTARAESDRIFGRTTYLRAPLRPLHRSKLTRVVRSGACYSAPSWHALPADSVCHCQPLLKRRRADDLCAMAAKTRARRTTS